MRHLYLILCLATTAKLYSADLQEKKLSLEEIGKQVAFLIFQTEECTQKTNRVEKQIEELKVYDQQLCTMINEMKERLSQQAKELGELHGYNDGLLEIVDEHHNKIESLTIKRCSSCPDMSSIGRRLKIQEAEQRSIKEDIQSLIKKQRNSEEKGESMKKEIEQLKRTKK